MTPSPRPRPRFTATRKGVRAPHALPIGSRLNVLPFRATVRIALTLRPR